MPDIAQLPAPPIAKKVPTETVVHGDRLVDDYAWLRDRAYPEVKDPEVIAYLQAENAYLDEVLAPQRGLRDALFEELKARIKEDDSTVPYRYGDYWYYQRFETGQQYPIRCRRAGSPDGPEQVILDQNKLAEGLEYLSVRAAAPSPDHRLLAYSMDDDGSERYRLCIKDLQTGAELPDEIVGTSGGVTWANPADGPPTFFYTELDEHLRPKRVFRHAVGTEQSDDVLVYEEDDPRFFLGIGKTRCERFLMISASAKDTSEVWLIPADRPEAAPQVVERRRDGHEYDVETAGDAFYILTNDTHRNFRLVTAPLDQPGMAGWLEVIAASDAVYLTALDGFRSHLVIFAREDGLRRVQIMDVATGKVAPVAFPDPVFTVGDNVNAEFETDRVRLSYTSLVAPPSVIECAFDGHALTTLKVQEIPSGYEADLYTSERLTATAADGTRVPISLVTRKDRASPGPLYLYGYGSYGFGLDPTFSTGRLSLLDRGFAVAIAHIRGGDEMGYHWYEDGKLGHKMNTFTDFVACAEHLIAAGYTTAGDIAIAGGSAGGMLMGAVINMRPELFRACVAHVPFVDCLATMLDDTLPLTPPEFKEWGNPENEDAYGWIKAYSPYDNVRAQAYPHLLVTAGISDPRVTYWEPAKWVAKLRATKTDDHLLLLKTNMSAGHGGPSGRFEGLKEVALEYAFLFRVFGKA